MHDGRAAVILLDPADFEGVAFELMHSFNFRGVGIPYRHTAATQQSRK